MLDLGIFFGFVYIICLFYNTIWKYSWIQICE